MKAKNALAAAVLLICVGLADAVDAQRPSPACGAPPVVAAHARPNIFSEQQEQWLGEAMADSVEGEWTPVRDASLNAHVQAIADRLLAVLPPTAIKFRVMLIDSANINGMSLAGGHIYLTRKLAALAEDDDELAGVIGHEIGHIASHQFAFESTADLQRLLGVISLRDRADVYAKYQALMDARLKDKHPIDNDSDDKQDEADRIGVYASAAAGYRPAASAELWDRVFFVDGKTRGRVADFFGITKPSEKRLRELRALAAGVPPGCVAPRPADVREFTRWHDAVVANQQGAAVAHADVGKAVALAPALRMPLDQVRFSPDGQSILAQDESSIFVLSREPFALRYRIDAEDALPANFSPDSQSLTFSTPGLHTEQWSAAEKKLIAAHELISAKPCYESKLAPDGRSLLCVNMEPESQELSLSLLDTATSQVVWEKKPWSVAAWDTAVSLLVSRLRGGSSDVLFAAYSGDNNVLLFGSGPNKLALDLRSRTSVKLGGGIGDLSGEYAFLGSDRLVSINPQRTTASGIYTFPEGRKLQTVFVPPVGIHSVTNAGSQEHMLMYGAKNFDVALGDLHTSKLLVGLKSHVLDEYEGTLVLETAGGGVAMLPLAETSGKAQRTVELPLSQLAELQAVSASPSGRYLALSTLHRGAVWDTVTGEQLFLLHEFTDAAWASDDAVYLDMAKRLDVDRHIVEISMKANTAKNLPYEMDKDTRMRYGRLTAWKQDGKKKTWTLTLHDPADDKVVWSRDFPDAHLGYTASFGDRDLLFSFGLKTNTAKDAMKKDSKLADEAAAVKNKEAGRLIEVIDSRSGVPAGELIVELPPNYAGIDGVNRAGDLLYVTGGDDRTRVYSMASGKEVRSLFGVVMALDPETGRVCTANRVGEAVVYDTDGAEVGHFQMGNPIRYAAFRANGRNLMVLTADQKLRIVAVAAGAAAPPAMEKAQAAAAP